MSRRVLTLLVLAAVSMIVAIIAVITSGKKMPFDEKMFAIEDTAQVGRVVIVDREGNRVELTRQSTHWIVNGRFPAEPASVQLLLGTLLRQRIRQKVPASATKNVIEEMAVSSVKVSVFDRDGKRLLSFFVGHASPDNTNTYMLIEDDTTPYMVYLPGFIGVLTPRYHTQVEEWRRKTFWSFSAGQLTQVSVEYPQFGEPGYVLTRSDGGFSLHAVPSSASVVEKRSPDTIHIHEYIGQFSKVGVVRYIVQDTAVVRSYVDTATPYAILRVHLRDNKKDSLIVWLKPTWMGARLTHDPATGDSLLYDVDYVFVRVPGTGELALMQWHTLGRIARYYFEFFREWMPPVREPVRVYPGGKVMLPGWAM